MGGRQARQTPLHRRRHMEATGLSRQCAAWLQLKLAPAVTGLGWTALIEQPIPQLEIEDARSLNPALRVEQQHLSRAGRASQSEECW